MRFTKKLWLLLSICFFVALVPLFLFPSPDPQLFVHLPHHLRREFDGAIETNAENENVTKGTQKPTSKLNLNKSESTFKEVKETINDDGTLIPLHAIPSSLYYSFEPQVMSRSFLRSLQNSSRRIIRKWSRAGFHKYDSFDISDCERLTPECGLHLYLLHPQTGEIKDPNALPYRKCCVEHKALRETTVWVVRKLRAANMTYFLSTGTALGVRRHAGRIIPWDTDVDIAVYPNDKKRVEAIFRGNKEHYFEQDRNGKPMYWIHSSRNGKPRSGPHVEIFYDAVYTRFPHLLLPLEECFFYDEPVMCPNMKQFDEWFPSGWQVYGGGHYNGPGNCAIRENGKTIQKRRC